MKTDPEKTVARLAAGRLPGIVLGILTLPLALPGILGHRPASTEAETGQTLSKKAAESCAQKVKRLEEFSAMKGGDGTRTTRISEAELNSFLTFQLSPKYHPSLKSLTVRLEAAQLQGTAIVDFDQLGMTSRKSVTRMVASLLAGKHALTVSGKLVADGGQAHFQLERALFDDTSLPNLIVEEIISTVGKRQKPPFDPLQPSRMPYGIQKVDLGKGYIIVHQ